MSEEEVTEEEEIVEEVAENIVAEEKKVETDLDRWVPKSELGQLVKSGKIESIEDIWAMGKVIQEPEIVDYLLPDLEERVLKIGKGASRPFKWVQRMTDSGRRNKYFVMVAVGNKKGYVGIGIGKAKEYGSAIKNAIRNAKLNLIRVKMGCGSWDCGCGEPHSVPTKTIGKAGSIEVTLQPAPKGTGLIVNKTSRDILELAGIKDVWSMTKGRTAARVNLAKATFNALYNINRVKGK